MKNFEGRFYPTLKHLNNEYYILYLRHMFVYKFSSKYVKNKNTLELGCGEGYGGFFLSNFTKNFVAIDIDAKTILNASNNYKKKNLIFKYFDATSQSSIGKFDVVLSFQTIEHVKNVNKYLRTVLINLPKGGRFIFSTPNKTIRLKKGEKSYNKEHFHEYTVEELKKLLKKYFSKIEFYGLFYSPKLLKLEQKRIRFYKIIVKYDVLGLRFLIPYKYEPIINNSLKKVLSTFRRKEEKFSKVDLYLGKTNLEECVDIICVCTKPYNKERFNFNYKYEI